MHEVAIAQSIVELVEEQARRDAFTRVLEVRLAIGALSHVDPRALEFGFESAARGTVADGASLTIERPEGKGYCTTCESSVSVSSLGDPCPRCKEHRWLVTAGDDLRVIDLEVA